MEEKRKLVKRMESFIERKERELKAEKALKQDEMIEFEYYDKINHKKVIVSDQRKIKVALMEFDLRELIQNDTKRREECGYNPKTDDPIDDEQDLEKILTKSEVEGLIEDILQQTLSKIHQKDEDRKKIINFLQKNIFILSKNQVIALFLSFYLDFEIPKIAEFLSISTARARQICRKTNEKLQKIA